MIEFLLRELEKSSRPIFSKKELVGKSPDQFKELLDRKILKYYRPRDTTNERIRYPRCPHGCYLTVEGVLEAFCEEHPEEDPIPIDRDDLLRYTFSIEDLLKLIAQINNLSGSLQTIEGGFFYLGHKILKGKRIGFVMVRNLGSDWLTKLSGLKNICKPDEFLFALTPVTHAENIELENRLRQEKILLTTLLDAIDPQSFGLGLSKLLSMIEESSGATYPTKVFQDMDGLTWEEVSMILDSNDSIRITARNISRRINFAEIGFKDCRSGNTPDQLWEILQLFAQCLGNMNWQRTSAYNVQSNFKVKMSGLRKRLKTLMGIDDDPFYPYKRHKAYIAKFQIKEGTS